MVNRNRPFEVYMKLTNRKKLATLIAIQEVSKREVARAAGWKSHTYLLRLLSGEATTCEPEHAVRIAKFLGCDINDLFLPKVDTVGGTGGSASGTRRAKVGAAA